MAQLSGIEVTHDEAMFIDFIDSGTFEVPEALSLYLSAFGKTFLASGALPRFNLAQRSYEHADGLVGFFGRVGPQTHYLYAAYSCLAVSSARILIEIAYRHGDDRNWDLPDAIKPPPAVVVAEGPPQPQEAAPPQSGESSSKTSSLEDEATNYPTRNMVGYDYAQR